MAFCKGGNISITTRKEVVDAVFSSTQAGNKKHEEVSQQMKSHGVLMLSTPRMRPRGLLPSDYIPQTKEMENADFSRLVDSRVGNV